MHSFSAVNSKYNDGKSGFIWSEYYKRLYISSGPKNRNLRQKLRKTSGFSIQIYVHSTVFGAMWLEVVLF